MEASWNDLPNELKTIIIQHLGNNSRLSLRACSSQDLQLVRSVPYRTIYKLFLHSNDDSWSISIRKTSYGKDNISEFLSFEEFQRKLTELMENIDYIKWMLVLQTNTEQLMKISNNGKLARVGELFFYRTCIDPASIIEQIDSNYLKFLEFEQDNFDPHLLDIPKVINVNSVSGGGNELQDNQLLALKSCDISFWVSRNLTSSGLNNFIKKCVLNLDEKPVAFRIYYNENTIKVEDIFENLDVTKPVEALQTWSEKTLLNSPLSYFQLEVEYGIGFIYGRTLWNPSSTRSSVQPGSQSCLKVVESIDIVNDKNQKNFIIKEKNSASIHYEFRSPKNLQLQLTEQLNEIDCVKEMVLVDTTGRISLQNSKQNKTCVGSLCIVGGNSVDILRQIDPVFLKEISARKTIDDYSVFDLPHVIHASNLCWANCHIRDDQLLKLNATLIDFNANDREHRSKLTESGINEFLKKSLLILNTSEFHLKIASLPFRIGSSQLTADLDVFSEKRNNDESWHVILNSNFPKFQLNLSLYRNYSAEDTVNFSAERIERSTLF